MDALRNAVQSTIDAVRLIESESGITRESLEQIREHIVALTGEKELFDEDTFPPPSGDSPARIYLLSEDEDGRFALYLICGDSRVQAPPHNHTTWAVIAGMSGEEENVVYDRIDDGSLDGKGEVTERFRKVLREGDGIAFMPDDIHSIRVISEECTRHFHLYGKCFAQQVGRIGFKQSDGTVFTMPDNSVRVNANARVDGR